MARRLALLLPSILCLSLMIAARVEAAGLFACLDPSGREVCVLDTGNRTGFSPDKLCSASCPACAGACTGVRRFATRPGHWKKVWEQAPGQGQDNRLVPGGDTGRDAATIIRDGLAGPETPPQAPLSHPPAVP